MTPTPSRLALACLATLGLIGLPAVGLAQDQAAVAQQLDAAVRQAIDHHPEVTARLNALRAAENEARYARGAWLPRIDLEASVGRDSDRITSRSPASQSLSRNGLALSASQTLWDGLATRDEVQRLDHAVQTRYFEFQSTADDTALEAAKAYVDVLRYRELVKLAEDNYVQHKYVSDQLQLKKSAGVGRGVDVEQANARLALAESNLATEVANLHDVSARFLRLVGQAPSPVLARPTSLQGNLGSSQTDVLSQALAHSPAISAAVENLRAAQAQAQGKESAYQPKVEARVRSGVGKNFDGVQNQKRDTAAEIVLNWNLYNGGSDQARVKQYADLINQAADLRDKACRDVRQTTAIAHNDIAKLTTQLGALDRNVLAIAKARDAYRQQFDIGQRSLLDLLNAENELYTAKRAYANAEWDLQTAQARTHAARHTLLTQLGLQAQGEDAAPEGTADWQAGDEAAQRCPVLAIDAASTPLSTLDQRARQQAPVAANAPVATPSALPTGGSTKASTDADAVSQRLRDWAAAWMSKDHPKYAAFYAKGFTPAQGDRARWTQERQRLLAKPGPIVVLVENIQATAQGDTVTTAFTQRYTSSNFKDVSRKVLTWKQESGQWVIDKESNR